MKPIGGMPLAGSSAGSLIAACFNAGMDKHTVWSAVMDLAKSLRKVGAYGNMGPCLD